MALWGCSESRKAAPAPAQLEEDTTTILFAPSPSESTTALCPDAVRAELGVTVPVRVWAPQGMPRTRLQRHTRALQASMLHLGIHFRAVGGVRALEEDAAFVDAGADGTRALAKASQGGQLDPVARAEVLAPFVSAPLRRMLAKTTPETRSEVQVFFVEHIASRKSPIASGLRRAAGLTLSPFAAEAEHAEEVAALIGTPLTELGAPVIVLSLHELARLSEAVSLTTLAHEMGHAFGLAHGGGRENLMSPMRHGRCAPGLSEGQVEVLRSKLADVAASP